MTKQLSLRGSARTVFSGSDCGNLNMEETLTWR